VWLAGCGGGSSTPPKSTTPAGGTQAKPGTHDEHSAAGKHDEHAGHMEGEHKEAGHDDGEHKEAGHAEGHKEGHGHSEADAKAAVAKIASYAEAMHEIDEHREEIEHLIESGKLGEVHPPAQHIAMIAKRLPELAQKSGVPQEHWKDINTQSRDLANLFDEIDEAGDAGKKPETEAAFAKMVKLIDSLKTHAPKQEN
jgi:hypothetical protein